MKTIVIDFGDPPRPTNIVFKMLKVEDSLKFLLYLGKLAGGAVGSAMGAMATGDNSQMNELGKKMNMESMGNNLGLLISRIDEQETIDKINLLLKSVSHEGNILHVNYMLFDNGRIDLLFKFVKEAFLMNYQNFFYENRGVLEKLNKTMNLITKSSTQSKGQT